MCVDHGGEGRRHRIDPHSPSTCRRRYGHLPEAAGPLFLCWSAVRTQRLAEGISRRSGLGKQPRRQGDKRDLVLS